MKLKVEKWGKSDRDGNMLFLRVQIDENDMPVSATCHLKLKSEHSHRMIGNYNFVNHTLYVQRNSRKHYHYKMQGYGFNEALIMMPELDIKHVCLVVDETDRYTFPVSLIKQYGRYLNFKEKGFELQRFVTFGLIKMHSKTE